MLSFKKIKYISLILLSLLILNKNVYAYDYVIDKYDINIKVNENNTFDIEENIDVFFNIESHGIYRSIPRKNKVERLDGTITYNRGKLKNLIINDEYKKEYTNDYYDIKIGSNNETIIGEKHYTIKYNYGIGKDPLKDKDEFYFNIIGSAWDTTIKNITFKITMPKTFDKDKIGFSKGTIGNTENKEIKYSVDGLTITGLLDGMLNPNEALTIRMELEEGYFKGINYSDYIYLIPIISTIICLLIWLLYGKNKQVIETVEFYPPEDMNSLELAYFYKGKANNKDVVSLLVYLASKGYLKINVNKNSFTLTKLKDYDGDNNYEKIFFDNLFSGVYSRKVLDGTTFKNITDNVSLKNGFYKVIDSIIRDINNKKDLVFIDNFKQKIIMIILIFINLISMYYFPIYEYGSIEQMKTFFIMILVIFIIFIVIFKSEGNIIVKVLIIGICLVAFTYVYSLIIPIFKNKYYLYNSILDITSIIIIIILLMFMNKRSNESTLLLGKILGFKNFLITANKDQLVSFVEKNPTYFYDILPYAYVLGITNLWIKKFETITIPPVVWYESLDNDISNFDKKIDDIDKSMNYTPRYESFSESYDKKDNSRSSSYSGGGSSGHGSSGGGGRRW